MDEMSGTFPASTWSPTCLSNMHLPLAIEPQVFLAGESNHVNEQMVNQEFITVV